MLEIDRLTITSEAISFELYDMDNGGRFIGRFWYAFNSHRANVSPSAGTVCDEDWEILNLYSKRLEKLMESNSIQEFVRKIIFLLRAQ